MEHIENVYPRSMSNVFLEAWTVVKIDTHETRWAAEVDDKVLQALISLERVNWGFTTEEEKGFSNKYQNTRYILNNIKAVKYIYMCVLWCQIPSLGPETRDRMTIKGYKRTTYLKIIPCWHSHKHSNVFFFLVYTQDCDNYV